MAVTFQEKPKITIVGAGLAGSECALQLADRGYSVTLYEMRDKVMTPAHKSANFAELVCSNSLGSQSEGSAPQQLKWEAEKLNSHILKTAQETSVPAGQALSVDRDLFSSKITQKIKSHPGIEVINKIVNSLDEIPRPAVIATGPLTSETLAESIRQHFSTESNQKDDFLYFFDAIAPIIDADSINTEIAWRQDRYNKGTPDYLNCPMNKEQYFNFIREIAMARKIEPRHFETTNFFEGCMPIEVMVERGPHTLRFGPMKPVGLKPPGAEREPYAVVQLRQENKERTSYNMVGFQTRMAYPEQQRIFRIIPGLENAEFLKLGSIHRNLFINSPKLLNKDLSSKNDSQLFFAGQITGVEGYFESTSTGLMVAYFLDKKLKGDIFTPPPPHSAIGALLHAVTDIDRSKHFQPTNINFGLFPPIEEERLQNIAKSSLEKLKNKKIDKNLKKQIQIEKARQAWSAYITADEHK